MSSSPDSGVVDDRDDRNQGEILQPSSSSSDFIDQSDTNCVESKLSVSDGTSRARHDELEGRPHNKPSGSRVKKSKTSRKHYSDHYLELFKATVAEFESGEDGVPSVDLPPTQLGAVNWQPSEKKSLFNALSRRSRLDEPGIATAVGRSELEVRDYLMFLREREAERHLFEKQTKRISHADIPAAIEISEECETALEQAADALAVFQDQYDRAVAEHQRPGTWLINWDTARALDERVLDHEEAGSDSEDLPTPENVPAEGLFRLSSWLELSERVFMNPGPPRLHANWHNLTTGDERPALTYAALSDFHDLTVSITRRLVQTCIFLTESRIRSTKGQGYTPKPSIKEQDAVSALEILGLTSSLSDRLIGVARRNSLCVVQGSHDKGRGRSQVLSYDEVEKEISRMKRSRRGRRSVSTASRSSETPASVEGATPETERHGPKTSTSNQPSRDVSPLQISIQKAELDLSMSDASMSDTSVDAEDSQVNEYGGISFHASTSRQKRRRIHLELQQDSYMEDLDRLTSEKEELLLWQALGRASPTTAKSEKDDDLGIRPKTLRKTREDLADWQGPFAAEWEVFGERLLKDDFVENTLSRG